MFNMEKFAQLITTKRKDKGLTQGQLSELVGVTHQAVSKWERAEAMPEISKIGDIAKALDTPADEFMNAMYDSEEKAIGKTDTTDGDEAYFKLEDKTRVGDIYALAPKLSKPVLELAIDTLISAKGAAAASMLFRFADREYLSELGNILFKKGDTSLAEYVDEKLLHSAIIDIISLDPDMRICVDRVGKLLTYCKNGDFVNNMFDYMLARHTYWNPWKGYISKFPSEAVINQGIKMAVSHGPNCFHNWWDVIGRRNVAKIFIGYIENFEKNNSRVWQDISRVYTFADSSIMEKYIKERLSDEETNFKIIKPLYHYLSEELKGLLDQKDPTKVSENIDTDLKDLILARIAEEISNGDMHKVNMLTSTLTTIGKTVPLSNGKNRPSSDGKKLSYEELVGNIDEIIEELESRIEDLESRIEELESRIEDLE